MRAQLLIALIGLTGFGASAQQFLPGGAVPPAAAFAPRPVIFAQRPAPVQQEADFSLPTPSEPARVPPPTEDRMMVTGAAGIFSAVAQSLPVFGDILDAGEGVPDWQETFRGRWHMGKGVRFRVIYENSRGVTWWTPRGFHLVGRGIAPRVIAAPEDTRLKDSYAVYKIGDYVVWRVEVLNVSGETLNNLSIESRQEALDHRGRAGRELSLGALSVSVPSLAAGKSTFRQAFFKMEEERTEGVNFQQTHVVIRDGKGNVLADVPQAAIIDPPAR